MKIKLPPGEALEVVPGDGGQSILRLFNGSHATDLKFPATTPAQGQTMVADGSGGLVWQYIPTIPDQTGQSGKVLTTNGSTLSWATQNGGSGALFRGSTGRTLSMSGVNARWRNLREMGLVRTGTVYALRHSCVTRMLESGVSETDVAALLGTSTTMIARTYSHVSANLTRLRGLVDRMAG
jgi:hypothetical protein